MKFLIFALLQLQLNLTWAEDNLAEAPEVIKPCTLALTLTGAVGPATLDYLQRADKKAKEDNCGAIYIKVNTPGGSLDSTRKIVQLIMTSPIPYLCLISPSGGHAGSAGAIIMQACHVSGGMEATNLGAATPIASTGADIAGALQKKVYEDTRSWVEGLAKYRERSVEFARDIVLEGMALDARDAAKVGGIDTVVSSEKQFLDFAEKLQVKLDSDKKSPVAVGPMEEFPADLRHDVMQMFSNPQWAYMIFMASLGLIYFELTHAGVFLPGIVGAIGLVISMMNFHMLDVSWGAVALMVLGVGFMFAELFITSFGALGVGGVVSFFIGSLFLFDKKTLGQTLPLSLIIATTLCLSVFMGGLTYLAFKALEKQKSNREKESWEGRVVKVKSYSPLSKKGYASVDGELWKFKSKDSLEPEDRVRIEEVRGLTLFVKRV